ncbi:MAG TPA: phosphopentomutase [Xanthomonadales bacterium]|nr:phosphopentomutase [Xanthomonadales bacterium]
MTRAAWLVLDSLGIGGAPDAGRYRDAGADTYGHIAAARRAAGRPLAIPNLERLGLVHAHAALHGRAFEPEWREPIACWGHAVERAPGKDTPSGHWESTGVALVEPFGLFERESASFPKALLDALVTEGALPGVLGNCRGSGTALIDAFGAAHCASGAPIVYTSADSVLQIAAHEQAFGLERLYALCAIARRLVDPYRIARVIARPFEGDTASGFRRTDGRRDYSMPPPGPTLLDAVAASGAEVVAVGKIADVFAGRGVTRAIASHGLDGLFDATLAALDSAPERSLVATNFVDFDMLYGHRRDVEGYAAALEAFDGRVPELLAALRDGDLLVLSADHGCDPTWPGSDHTRECVPVLAFARGIAPRPLGRRDGFADIGQGIAAHLGLAPLAHGRDLFAPQDPSR